MNIVYTILRNKWFWIALGAVVLLLVLRGPITRAWATIKRGLMRDSGDYSQGITDGSGNEVSGAAADARRKEIEALAEEAYAQLTAGVVNPFARERALEALLSLNDTELRVAAKHYKMLSRDKSLYQAVDGAWMPASDVDETLMGRLSNIAMI